MTAAVEEPRRDSRLLMFAGHYSHLAVGPALALSMANDAAGDRITPLLWVTSAAWILAAIPLAADLGYHAERLCERCINATPLDAAAEAERRRPVLRLHHAARIRVAALAGLLAATLLVTGSHHPPPGWARAAHAVFLLAGGVLLGSDFRHRKLYPWCPWCRWDGGGDHEVSPDVPAPAVSR